MPGAGTATFREHNREALRREIALVARFIEAGMLRDLVESRCRLDAAHVTILRQLDNHYSFMERHLPVARSGVMRANSGESLQRAESPPVRGTGSDPLYPPEDGCRSSPPLLGKKTLFTLPEPPEVQQAVGGRAHELIVTSPLGLVPRELECIYPGGHYDVPVTGYWDAEERAVIAGILARYFERHRYRRIIAHLDGGALAVAQAATDACGITLEYSCTEDLTGAKALNALDAALESERRIKDDRLHGMASYQFNCDIDTRGITLRGHFPELFYSRGLTQLFSIDTGTGLLRPTFDGWNLIPEGYRVSIDDFIPEGDVLVPGVTHADPGIRDGDEVLVTGPRLIATGRAALPAEEMAQIAPRGSSTGA